MSSDLRDRLRKLNVHKGAAHIAKTPKPKRRRGIETLIDGDVIETDYGPTFVHIERYAPDYVHGSRPLGELFTQSWSVAAQIGGSVTTKI